MDVDGGGTFMDSMDASGFVCTVSMNLNAFVVVSIANLFALMRNNIKILSYANKRTLQGAGDDAGGFGTEAGHSAFVAVAGYRQEPTECGVPGADCGCAEGERG